MVSIIRIAAICIFSVLVALFFRSVKPEYGIYMGFAAGLLLPDNEISEKENRTLSQCPNISASSILNGSFMENVEAYLS